MSTIKPTPTPVPIHKLGIAMQHIAESGKSPCFRIEGIRITMASVTSVNPGYLYIKTDNWGYIGKISPSGLMKITHPSKITSEQKTLVLAAIVDPEGTAMSNGKDTGTCCCCGRKLTNKLSIELGIGPICRGFWFPAQDSLELGSDLEDLSFGTTLEDSLDLETPAPAPAPKEPVKDLITSYFALTPAEQHIFLGTIKEELVNDRN